MSANAGRQDLDHLLRAKHIPDDEPIFHTRGRDPAAAASVRAWAARAFELGVPIAVIEQALQQADALEAWPVKRLPDGDHLSEDERKQLEYQFRRRAWRARAAAPDETAIMLAEQRGYDAAIAKLRYPAAVNGDVVTLASPDASRG